MALTIKELISEQKIFCGILAQEGNQFYVKSNTLTIPFFNEEESPDFAFGCIINKSGKFQAHYIIESSKRLMNNLSVTNIHLPALEWKIIETPKYHFVDQTHIAITLDNSDVPGPYEIKLFIDNKLSKQVTFIIQ